MTNLFDSNTNKQGLIVYGGESSSSYGMVVAEAPAYERPKRKQTIYNVPGRSGSVIFQEDAWEDVNRPYKVWLAPSSTYTLTQRVDALEAWLNSKTGYVRLEDNFEPDIYRLAYYSGGDSFTNSMTQYGEATLNFTCRAERFLKSGESLIAINMGSGTTTSFTINNPTKYTSKPLLSFKFDTSSQSSYNSLKFQVTIGLNKTITVDLSKSSLMTSSWFRIDCETMCAYFDEHTGNYNQIISGNFPVIPSGQSIGVIRILEGSASVITNANYKPRYFTI